MSHDAHDTRALRDAFGAFMTGVTIVTSTRADGAPVGLTANSFTSVSLDPALLLVCVSGKSRTLPAVRAAQGFAVNILAEGQEALSNRFAGRAEDRFEGVDWHPGPRGGPILPGACGWFDCALDKEVDAGDHIILIGRVEGFEHLGGAPLGYAKGGYFSLGR